MTLSFLVHCKVGAAFLCHTHLLFLPLLEIFTFYGKQVLRHLRHQNLSNDGILHPLGESNGFFNSSQYL